MLLFSFWFNSVHDIIIHIENNVLLCILELLIWTGKRLKENKV